ncbi:MAG: AtpZ/AtpI family protein [Thermomicrobiales bacterium]
MQMPSPEDRAQLGAAGAAAGLGCSIVVSVILFIGGGIALDRATDQSPLFTLIGIALALVSAGYQLYELTRVGRTDRAPGPITRQISRLPVGQTRRGGTSRAGPEQPGSAEQREEE